MTDRSIVAHEYYRDASQRFEYFILGVSSALCAYIGQHLTPQRLGFTPHALELFSLLLLVGSVFVGFKRIEKVIASHAINHNLLSLMEQRGQLVANFKGQPLVNALRGESLRQKVRLEGLQSLRKRYQHAKANSIGLQFKLIPTTRCRNWLLASGFLGLLVSKILTPYFP